MSKEIIGKDQLVNILAEKAQTSKNTARAVLEAFLDTVPEELAKGNKVKLIGFGLFEVKDRAERVGRNPVTGDEIKIPAKKVPSFSAGKSFKESVAIAPKKKK